MAKQNIAIIAGGDSGEYNISIKSGSVVDEMLDKIKYNTYLIQIKGRMFASIKYPPTNCSMS